MNVLIVDDDLELLGLTSFALRSSGYQVAQATDGVTALEMIAHEPFDLAILDVNLPRMNGFEVCRHIRAQTMLPVMLLTVRTTEDDQVYGLDQGADQYLTKPFSPRALVAQVRALLRRAEPDAPAPLGAGDLRLDVENQTAIIADGEPVRLTNREFRLIHFLVANSGRTIPAERLASHIWGYECVADRQLLKQIVHRVRRKIERDPAIPARLLTVPGVGYRLQPLPHAAT
jgi:DNA-binding response OmpR family regulator